MLLAVGIGGICMGLGVLIGHRCAAQRHDRDNAAALASITALHADIARLPQLVGVDRWTDSAGRPEARNRESVERASLADGAVARSLPR